MIKLETMLERYIPGINFLQFSTSSYLPGSILDNEDNDFREGHLRDIFPQLSENEWELDYVQANLISGQIAGEKAVQAGANFLGLVNVKSDNFHSYSLNYRISEINGVEFKNTSMIELQGMFRKLKQAERKLWRQIKKDFIVTESYFAKSFIIEFTKEGKLLSEAEIKTNFQIESGVDVTWKSNGVVEVAGNIKVPFGVRGFIVR